MSKEKIVLCVVGARPNFMKIAPIMRAFKAQGKAKAVLVHTGQHYDKAMKHQFFDQLGIPEPDIDLEVGSGSHAVQTAEVMKRFEPVIDEQKPSAILVVGDVNSTIACALVASKKNIPVIHVESGLRSYDRQMPEEVNRVLTDQISDWLYTTEKSAEDNLAREGIDRARVIFAGNVMIDTLMYNLGNSVSSKTTLTAFEKGRKFLEQNGQYAVVTMHRPSNVDNQEILTRLLSTLTTVSKDIPIVFPVHPRTQKQIESFGLEEFFENDNVLKMTPLGYLELLGLVSDAKVVLTDSGGIQEETTALGVPCITLRENTERPITVTEGTNTVVGTDPDKILTAFADVMKNGGKAGRKPDLWDGKAAERIVEHINSWI
ncbi:MAG: UDP-N-acetylglucosamine 2-epimerase (non-hydrolyzing) [Gammaproteobacteria bacterium]|nr:UDP-N-acetylglucosamine 2-epimerase (non-hydrolyzing) [Gammaproteobacteria bacterium]